MQSIVRGGSMLPNKKISPEWLDTSFNSDIDRDCISTFDFSFAAYC
jgi:hypothetical protein